MKEVCGELPFRFRAGAWKPRTSPHTFQGAGAEALKWLKEVKERFGIDVATEVATPEQLHAALDAGIDYLWIGARTSANPMAVSAIAEAIVDRLRLTEYRPASPDRVQTGLPFKGILIKNPANEDAGLWLGNIERLEKTGVPVMAVHRGCNHRPCWHMAHEVRLARPDIPMLLDPSHMSGDAEQVPLLLHKIDELGLDGAMVEVHCDPKSALSDNNQQLTPRCLRDALDSIACRLRVVSVFWTHYKHKELNWLRSEIDELDEQLWSTIAARMEVSERIGDWKKEHNIAALQPERYEQIVRERSEWAKNNGLSEELVKQIFDLIHSESLRRQQ